MAKTWDLVSSTISSVTSFPLLHEPSRVRTNRKNRPQLFIYSLISGFILLQSQFQNRQTIRRDRDLPIILCLKLFFQLAFVVNELHVIEGSFHVELGDVQCYLSRLRLMMLIEQ